MRAERGNRRWSILPRLFATAPPRVLVVAGALVTALGVLVASRPLSSLLLLAVYVGISAIASGVIDLLRPRHAPHWWTAAFALTWIVGGIMVIAWIGRSLNALPVVLAVLLILGGISSLADAATRGSPRERLRVSERVLTAAWGAAQLGFGVLSLAWPNVTILVVAVVFGVRTAVFGLLLFWRGVVAILARPDRGGRVLRIGPHHRLAAAGRCALALVLVVVTTVGWTLNGWLADGAPVVDAFYDPPAVLPTGGPGELIRSDAYSGSIPAGTSVTRILYTTTDVHGREVAASGLVIIPHTIPLAPMPVVLWNHGSTGVARACAPSLRGDAVTHWAIPALGRMLAHGWAVVAPDYAGEGAPGVFPYLIGVGEARSALDAVRAAQRLPHVWLGDQVVVWGHSQGGHAALWAAQTAQKYAPGLQVLGVAALAPAGDPLALARDLTAGFASPQLTVLTAWVLVPYSETYPDVRIADYVAPGTRAIVRELAQRCAREPGLMVSVLAALGVSEHSPLYIGDLTAGALGRRLGQNIAGGLWQVPMLVAWGARDRVIPPSAQTAYVAGLCRAGNSVEWDELPAVGHQDILHPDSPLLPKLVDWTAGLFAHRAPPPDGCR